MRAPLPTPVRVGAAADARGRPLRDLRISVLDRCNFRCPYCMPADQYPEHHPFLQRQDLLSFEEIERLARVFVGLGVRKLRLTGGEPLLRRDLPVLVAKLAAIPGVEDLALTPMACCCRDWPNPCVQPGCSASRSAWTRSTPRFSVSSPVIAARLPKFSPALPPPSVRASA